MITYGRKNDLAITREKAAIILEALPYIQRFSGRRVLIKVGGELLESPEKARSFAGDLALLKSVGIEIVLCHGGGPQISRAMQQMGREAGFVGGLRVTDAETLRATSMVLMGEINQELVALINASGAPAVGISGASAQILCARQKRPELGYVGDIEKVNAQAVLTLLQAGFLPVVAPLGSAGSGVVYNVNADTAASALAGALGCEKLVLVTNVEGLYEDFENKASLISRLNSSDLRKLLETGRLTSGMIPKSEAILQALEHGVGVAHVIDGREKHALLLEIFTAGGIGTMVERG